MNKIILAALVGLSQFALAGLLFPYNRLATKDLDQMNKLIREKIKESKVSHGNRTIPLKEALQAVFSRPNGDGMIEKIIPPLRTELDELDAWEKTVEALVKEATGALKNPKAFKVDALVTYTIFLENLISETKPKVREPFENSIVGKIRDAKIELSKEVIRERKLRMLPEPGSPSEIADQVLKKVELEDAELRKQAGSSAGESQAPSEKK